jgi:hypothetical protein
MKQRPAAIAREAIFDPRERQPDQDGCELTFSKNL